MSIKGKPLTLSRVLLVVCLSGMVLGNTHGTLTISSAQETQVGSGDSSAKPVADADQKSTAEAEANAETSQPAEVNSEAELEPPESEIDGGKLPPTNETVELSVEPGTQPLLPADRPAWIGADPDYSGEVHRLYVGSTAVTDPEEVDTALDVPLLAALRNYLDDQVLNSLGAADGLNLNEAFIRRNLIPDPEGVVLKLNTSGEPMYQKWVAVEVTPTQRDMFRQWYREAVQRDRMKPLVASLAGLLGLVGLTHLLLRRKHGLPSSQPLVNPELEVKADKMAKATKRASRLWAPLIFMGGIFFLLVLLGTPLLVVSKKSLDREFVEEFKNHLPQSVVVDVQVGDDVQTTSVKRGNQQELIFESNGQQIIQRVQRVR